MVMITASTSTAEPVTSDVLELLSSGRLSEDRDHRG
jgi:hypothetical protein